MFKIEVFENSDHLYLEETVQSDHVPAPGHHINLEGMVHDDAEAKYAMVTDVCWNLEDDRMVPTVTARLGRHNTELRRENLWHEGWIGTNESPFPEK